MYEYDVIKKIDNYIQCTKDNFASSDQVAVVDVLTALNNGDAIIIALLAKALGNNRVIGVLMPNGFELDIDDAFKLCEQLNIKYIVCNIDEVVTSVTNSIKRSMANNYNMIVFNASNQGKVDIVAGIRKTILDAICQNANGAPINTSDTNEFFFSDVYTSEEADKICEYLGLSKEFTIWR